MELQGTNHTFEALVQSLNDDTVRQRYEAVYRTYTPALVPRILGGFLVLCGNIIYGREPSYLKFRAVEVIARVPYHSWAAASFSLLTLCYQNEARAMQLLQHKNHAVFASDNETMHVVVVSQLAAQEGSVGCIRYTLIPILFAFFYFWFSYLMYLVKPQWSFELNFLFEDHAYQSYDRFLTKHQTTLRQKPMTSAFLTWYGRTPANQYEFFESVRNDELVHRNQSLEESVRAGH
jgi:ubiquinol oxidase